MKEPFGIRPHNRRDDTSAITTPVRFFNNKRHSPALSILTNISLPVSFLLYRFTSTDSFLNSSFRGEMILKKARRGKRERQILLEDRVNASLIQTSLSI